MRRFCGERSRPMSRQVRVVLLVLLTVVLGAFIALVRRVVPFYAPSFLAWTGIAVLLAGLISIARPMRWLGIRTRRRALFVAPVGLALAMAALLWPAPVLRSAGPRQRLDDFLPEYQFREHHEGLVRAPMPAVLAAVREVSLADMPVAVLLMRIRAAAFGRFPASPPDTRPLLDTMCQPGTGFLPLDVNDPTHLVYGMVGFVHKPKPPVRTPEQFAAFTSPGGLRVAFDLRVVPEADGLIRVSTETRCLANDDAARRVFARYWRIIYPGSAIIRRVWLDAIIARAERGAGRSG